jgi:hypothetical protein
VALLSAGVVWLATTTSIADLVLNTAALCFVMDLDDLLLRALVPQIVQEAVGEAAPLKFRRPPWNLEAFVPLICIFAICVIVTYTIALGNIQGMVDTKKALCDGFQEFVSAKSGIGIVQGLETLPFENVHFALDDALRRYEVRAVRELMASKHPRDELNLKFVNWHRNEERVFDKGVQEDWIEVSRDGFCVDFDNASFTSSFRSNYGFYFNTAREIVDPNGHGRFSSEFTCSEYKPFCDGRFHALIRYLCPLTCGCDDATSGLLLGKVSKLGGCAMPCLQAVDAHVRKAPCSDLPVTSTAVEDKAANDGWTRYWRSFYETQAAALPSMAREYANLTAAKMRNGCADTTVEPGTGSGFCDQEFGIFKMNGWRSIVSFCPKTCCREQMLNECPEACSPDVPS